MSIDNTNFFSYVYSSWLTNYLWKAYREGISLSDIPPISPLDSCSYNTQKFENLWIEELRQRGPSSASLSLVAWRFVRTRVLISCTLNTCSQIIKFILQTLLLRKLLEHSESPEEHFLSGMHWILYIVVFDLLQMTLHTWSSVMNERTALRLKSACLSLLFKKVIHLNNITQKNTDQLTDILLNEGNKVYDAVNFGPSIINGPIVTMCAVICVAMWLSSLALTGFIVFLLFYLSQYWLVHLLDYCKENVNELTKTRMRKTIEAWNSIKTIQINGWEQHFIQNILNVRKMESKWLWKLSYVSSLNSSIIHAIPIITIILMFYIHFSMSYNLLASVAFPICVVVIVQLNESFISMKRGLSCIRDSARAFNKIKSGLVLGDGSCYATKPYEASQAVTIINGIFVYDVQNTRNYEEDYEIDEITKSNDVIANNTLDPEKEKLNTSSIESKRLEILSNINFKAKKGQLIGIGGQTNAGKSSLLLAALGQIKMTSGQLMRQGTCAYVAQRAWLANGTIRENILFEEAYDAKRYYEAQIVCKLRHDIKRLPDADDTEIGEGGVEIPETMRQKIALARAFYADRDIYFLDDPLNSIDNTTGEEIFEDFIVRALAEKTVLFVTNKLKYLDRCDYIYIMRDGKIVEHGRHKELIRLRKEYALMAKADMEGEYVYKFIESQGDESKEEESDRIKANKERKFSINYFTNMDLQLKRTNSVIQADNTGEPEEIKYTTYYTYVKSLGGFILIASIIVVYIMYAGMGVLSLLRLSWWIDTVNVQIDKENSFAVYKNWYGLCFFLVIFGCIVETFVIQFATTKISDNLHNALLTNLIHAPLKLFDNITTANIRNLFLRELEIVSLSLPLKLDNALRYISIGFFTFFVLISTIPWFSNYLIFTSVIFYFVTKIYRVSQKNLTRLENAIKVPTSNFLQNSVEGLNTIRTFKKENDILSKFQELIDENSSCSFIKRISERWLSIRLNLITTTCVFVAAYFTVILNGDISPAIAGLTFVYVMQIPNIILMSLKYYSKLEVQFFSVQNICDYIKKLAIVDDDQIIETVPDSKWPTKGLIEFDKVQLRLNNDTEFAINFATFTIDNGEKIGILSRSESTKSGLIGALCRLYELRGGKISIDHVDISKIDIKLLRNQLSIIPRDPICYGTIRVFLDPKNSHNDAEIWSALEKVYLKDKISATASQLNYSIERKVFNIIERQLLFLAKAHLDANKIVILEECNVAANNLVHQVIEKEFSSSTVLVIVNRVKTVLLYDRVLVVENGRVSEFDKPSNLLANRYSYLKKLMTEEEEINGRV